MPVEGRFLHLTDNSLPGEFIPIATPDPRRFTDRFSRPSQASADAC
jgi:hypothetical protein